MRQLLHPKKKDKGRRLAAISRCVELFGG